MDKIARIAKAKYVYGCAILLLILMLAGCEETMQSGRQQEKAPRPSDGGTSTHIGTYALRSANAEATLYISETSFSFAAAVESSGLVVATSDTPQESFIAVEGSANSQGAELTLTVESARRNQSPVSPDLLAQYKECDISADTIAEIGSALMGCIGADRNVTILSNTNESLDGTWTPIDDDDRIEAATLIISGSTMTVSGYDYHGVIHLAIHPTYFTIRVVSHSNVPPEQVDALNSEIANIPFWYIVRGSTLRLNVLLGADEYILHYIRA